MSNLILKVFLIIYPNKNGDRVSDTVPRRPLPFDAKNTFYGSQCIDFPYQTKSLGIVYLDACFPLVFFAFFYVFAMSDDYAHTTTCLL